MQHLSKLFILFFLVSCAPQLRQSDIPTAEQIISNPVVAGLQRHQESVRMLSSYTQRLKFETLEQIQKLDHVRYFYITKVETLIAEGKFKEADLYLTSANQLVLQIMRIMQNDFETQKSFEKEGSEKQFH